MSMNLSGSLGGQIDEMLQGSVAGNISLLNAPAVTEEIEITENGVYTTEEGVDGYSKVTVDVPTPTLETLNVTENGTYSPSGDVDGYDEVNVNVPIPTPTLETLNVTENGTYTPSGDVDGYDEVNVNVPTVTKTLVYTLNSGGVWETFNKPLNTNIMIEYNYNNGAYIGEYYFDYSNLPDRNYGDVYDTIGFMVKNSNIPINMGQMNSLLYISTNGQFNNASIKVYTIS